MRKFLSLSFSAIALTLVLFLGVLILSLGWAGLQSRRAVTSLRQGKLDTSIAQARTAQHITGLWSRLSFHQIPDLEIWDQSLTLLSSIPDLLNSFSQNLNPALENSTALQKTQQTQKTKQNMSPREFGAAVEALGELLPQTWLLKHVLSPAQQTQLTSATQTLQTINNSLLTGPQKWVVIFQNSQELRATGGFMGSLAFVTASDGKIEKTDVQDIYQPAGQLTGYLEPPAGAKEYLSSGKGWQLPDANWSPDFPSSAQQILQMLALSGHQNLNGVIAINLEVATALIDITGPIYLPDYKMTVTANNLADELRSNRDDFFPGSVAKQHLLANFFTHFQTTILNASLPQKIAIVNTLLNESQQKNVQFFASDIKLQKMLSHHDLTGEVQLPAKPADDYLYLVESNVGINKANRTIDRQVTLTRTPAELQIAITFTNKNTPTMRDTTGLGADHLHYVNYQRIYLKPDTKITAITYQDNPITNWDEKSVTIAGQTLTEIGFLITVPEQSQGVALITISRPQLTPPTQLFIQKQSGLPPVSYTILQGENKKTLTLTQDTIISF